MSEGEEEVSYGAEPEQRPRFYGGSATYWDF